MKNLSSRAKVFILSIVLAGTILIFFNIPDMAVPDLGILIGLIALSSLSLILKVEGSTNKVHYNISFLIYGFTFMLYGVPLTILVILSSNLIEWAWHQYPWYIQSFNIASYVIVVQLAGLVYAWFNPDAPFVSVNSVLGILTAMAVLTLTNHLMVGLVVYLARGENFAESGIFDLTPLMIDFTMLCMGVVMAMAWNLNPYLILLGLIPLYLISRTLKVPALERKSDTDSKTGLFNSQYFFTALEKELARSARFEHPITVAMADLDLLRDINNTYGHLAGDAVLVGVAEILKKSVRDFDVLSRFGGEEFAIIMPETSSSQAYEVVDAIRKEIEEAEFIISTSITPVKVTLSIGIAEHEEGQTADDIINKADVALYRAKLIGRNQTLIYKHEEYKSLFGADSEDFPKIEHTLFEATEEPDSENTEKPTWQVNLFIGGMILAALGLFSFTFNPVSDFDWLSLSVFGLLVVMTEWFSIDIYVKDTSVSTSAAPMIAGILLFGPIGAFVLGLVFATVAVIKHRSPISRYIFNISNQMIASLLYTSLVLQFGIPFSDWDILPQLLMSLVAGFIVYIFTTISIAAVVKLDRGISARDFWSEQFSWLVTFYLGMGLIAYALIYSFLTAGVVGIGIVLVPLLLLRFSQALFINRTENIVSELREKNISLQKSAEEISALNEELLMALSEVIDMRDPFVLGHSRQVARYATLIARQLSLTDEKIEIIRKAGLLHDIGKLGIPESILFKPALLTEEEDKVVQTHVTLGEEILSKCRSLHPLIPIVEHHHERWDGNGYPYGLKGDQIPLEARIMNLADSIEAMASDRPYREGSDADAIIKELMTERGSQFDPTIVDAFLDVLNEKGKSVIVNSARAEYSNIAVQPRELR